MIQYSNDILNLFGSPELSDLSVCGAKELDPLPNFLSAAMWNHIVGTKYRDPSILHLDLAFLRRVQAAFEAYQAGRSKLLKYVEGLQSRQHLLLTYLSTLSHFEQCIASTWQACELFNRIEHKLLKTDLKKLTLYEPNSDTDLERINKLNNISKHFGAEQAEKTVTPIWITNEGLKSINVFLHFDELLDNLVSLKDIAHDSFVAIPSEARKRAQPPERTEK